MMKIKLGFGDAVGLGSDPWLSLTGVLLAAKRASAVEAISIRVNRDIVTVVKDA